MKYFVDMGNLWQRRVVQRAEDADGRTVVVAEGDAGVEFRAEVRERLVFREQGGNILFIKTEAALPGLLAGGGGKGVAERFTQSVSVPEGKARHPVW